MYYSNKALDGLAGKPKKKAESSKVSASTSESTNTQQSWDEYEEHRAQKMFDCFPASSSYQGNNTFITSYGTHQQDQNE